MDTKKTNRSVQRTCTLLKRGLAELMQQKPPSKITVSELTDYVNLNRGTFYLHYKDINDLLDKMEDETLSSLRMILDSYQVQEVADSPFFLIRDVFRLLSENADLCMALLTDNTHDPFMRKIQNIVREKCLTDWENVLNGKDPEQFDLFYSFAVSGIIGILEHWFVNGMQQSVDEIASLTNRFILHGMDAL